jgi:hypothetical protein
MIITGYLFACGAPLVTHINVKTYLLFNNSYVYSNVLAEGDEQEVYANGSYEIRILANNYQNYSIGWYQSNILLDQAINLTTYPSLLNITYTFVSGNNYTLNKIEGDWKNVIPPILPTEVNFFKNKLDSHYYVSSTCNYHQGAYDSNLELIHPWTVNGVSGGGSVSFTTGEIPRIPIAIPPNPLYNSYKENCNAFYPKSTSFQGFGIITNNGATYERMQQDQERCYAPFYAPELIIGDGGTEIQDERFRQCFMLGGSLANLGQDVCWRPIAHSWCKDNYYYFGGYCYYKFNPIIEASAFVVIDESNIVCAQLEKDIPVESVSYVNYDVDAWIRGFYVYINNIGNSSYRIPVVNTICNCYAPGNTTSCNCQSPAFPICRYNVKNYEVIDRWVRHAPETIAILRDGQSGSKWNGKQFNCDCYNGWCDSKCNRACCPFPTTLDPNDAQSLFFGKCYSNGRGSCEDNDPRVCKCSSYYGPPANLITGENIEFPCSCPAISGYTDLSIINNATYNFSNSICGGRWQGSCVVDDYTNFGECDPIQRTRLTKYFNLEKESAYNGKATSCRVARVFEFTDIEQTFCNNKGTCCPFGERSDGSTGYCPPDYHGCYCDNGWDGEACTGISPFNLKSSLPFPSPKQVQFIWCNNNDFLIDFLPNTCVQYEPNKYYCNVFLKSITNCDNLTAAYNDWFEIGGNYTNPFSGRFSARKENRFYDNYLETQPYYYATKGVTNSKGMCDSNHTGIGCFMGISNTVTKALCGETTLPKRGYATPDSKCYCNTLGENGNFYGDACENFIFNYKTCSGHGTPTLPNFPYGTCSGDIHTNDSLNDPFFFVQNDLDRFNPWEFKEASFIMSMDTNLTYYFKNTFTTVYMEKVYGTTFNTCNSTIKLVMPLQINNAVVQIIQFNLTLSDNTNIVVDNLRNYIDCIGLNQTAFYDSTLIISCYTAYTIIFDGEVTTINNDLYEITCVNAVTVLPLINYNYGKIYCNNAYQRNIDKALWIYLGEDNYTLQCANEPIKPYDTPDFYGLLEEYNSTRIELILGNKLVPLDILDEKFFDDYLISWVSPYINRTYEDVNIGQLGNIVPLDSITQLIFLFFETYSTNVIYDFLNERWTNFSNNGIGSPYRVINTTNYYDLLVASRNYSGFYSMPGIALILPTYRRQFQNLTNLTSDAVNSIIFTPPVNLESVSIYARNGTLCGHVLYPRANISITVSCGFDPFLYDANYLEFFDQITDLIIQSTTAEEFTIYFSALATEGVRVNIVPENFHGIGTSLLNSFTTPYKDHCITNNNFTFPTPDLCHTFAGAINTIPNFANYYFNDWYTNQGYVPVGTEMNNTLNNFYNWFNLSFTQSPIDLSTIWQNIDDFPLHNINISYPVLDCTVNITYCYIVWHTWLAPRKCTFNDECENNALGNQCIFPDNEIPPIGWRQGNGDKSLGIEGGCICDYDYDAGFHTQFCDVCQSGYGPTDNCTLPVANELVCGIDGIVSLNVTIFNETGDLQIVGNKVPTCLDITYDGVKYYLVPGSFIYIKKTNNFLISYMNDDLIIINIIDDVPYGIDEDKSISHCTKYTDDSEYFIEYFNNNTKIEFIDWLHYISYINYI